MKWTAEAEAAIKKVPFFVRKKVIARVEKETAAAGKSIVSLAEVDATRKRYLTRMESEVKGYQTDICFGPGGCPNRVADGESLHQRIEALLAKADLVGFLKRQVKGELKFHHEFRVTIAECPNACSQPQIKDIGIVGACRPGVTDTPCTLCGGCAEACPDDAVSLDPVACRPVIDTGACMRCGKCIPACPTGTIGEGERGYTIYLAGKLGRHPRLARPLPGIYSPDEVLDIVSACVQFYKENSRNGKRFAEIFTQEDFDRFAERFEKP